MLSGGSGGRGGSRGGHSDGLAGGGNHLSVTGELLGGRGAIEAVQRDNLRRWGGVEAVQRLGLRQGRAVQAVQGQGLSQLVSPGMMFMVFMVIMVTSVPAQEAVTLPLLLSKEERKPLGSSENTRPSQTLTQNQSQTKLKWRRASLSLAIIHDPELISFFPDCFNKRGSGRQRQEGWVHYTLHPNEPVIQIKDV